MQIIQIVAGLGAIIAVMIATIELINFIKHSKIERTYRMIDRFWNTCSPRMIEIYERYRSSINNPHSPPFSIFLSECTELVVITSYFEELGFMWSGNVIDKKIIRIHLTNHIINAFESYSDFIDQQRIEQNRSNLCIYWQRMVNDLKNAEPESFNELIKKLRVINK